MRGTLTSLFSKEGVTQGDPLSMLIYAIGTIPLISTLDHPRQGSHVWYADDASACSDLPALKEWFQKLLKVGPSYGYYPEPSKSFIVVNANFPDEAQSLFDDLHVNIVTSQRLLGSVVGESSECLQFVNDLPGSCRVVSHG